MSRLIVGISGGTGSGKTTVAKKIMQSIGESRVLYLQQDSYYRDLDQMPPDERRRANFDHPDAFDGELMLNHLESLRNGKSIERPVYDYVMHSRKKETSRMKPRPVILVEGILVFYDPRMRRLMDLKVYVDCDADIRFIRRLERDIKERGRSVESVIEQYMTTVRPMHLKFVAPTIRHADIILPEGGFNDTAIDLIVDKILSQVAFQGDSTGPA